MPSYGRRPCPWRRWPRSQTAPASPKETFSTGIPRIGSSTAPVPPPLKKILIFKMKFVHHYSLLRFILWCLLHYHHHVFPLHAGVWQPRSRPLAAASQRRGWGGACLQVQHWEEIHNFHQSVPTNKQLDATRRISAKIASYTDNKQLDEIRSFLQRWTHWTHWTRMEI